MKARFDLSVVKRQTKSRSSSERGMTKESFDKLVSGAAVSTIHRTVASSGPFAPPCPCVNGQIGVIKVSNWPGALPCQLGRAYSCIHLWWVVGHSSVYGHYVRIALTPLLLKGYVLVIIRILPAPSSFDHSVTTPEAHSNDLQVPY